MSGPRLGRGGRPANPFALLGLPASASVTDDDVRSAWRRTAAATHPDRPDGGDPARFADASAAYTILRTRAGRGEALADLGDLAGTADAPRAVNSPPREAPAAREFAPPAAAEAVPGAAAQRDMAAPGGILAGAVARIWHGRPAVLAARLAVVAAAGAGSAALVGSAPATPALITGALTWLVLTARHDLAPPRGTPGSRH